MSGRMTSGFRGSKERIMRTYDIHEAKAQLSRLVERAARGEIVRDREGGQADGEGNLAGCAEASQRKRFGFMAGQVNVPADFNTMGAKKIQKLFESRE